MTKLLTALFINAELAPFSPNRAKYQSHITFDLHQ